MTRLRGPARKLITSLVSSVAVSMLALGLLFVVFPIFLFGLIIFGLLALWLTQRPVRPHGGHDDDTKATIIDVTPEA